MQGEREARHGHSTLGLGGKGECGYCCCWWGWFESKDELVLSGNAAGTRYRQLDVVHRDPHAEGTGEVTGRCGSRTARSQSQEAQAGALSSTTDPGGPPHPLGASPHRYSGNRGCIQVFAFIWPVSVNLFQNGNNQNVLTKSQHNHPKECWRRRLGSKRGRRIPSSLSM